MWRSTRFYHYILPRQMARCCLLPLLYQYRRDLWNSYCSGIESILAAFSPATIQLFFISFFAHFLRYCVETPSSKSPPIFGIPRILRNEKNVNIMEEVTGARLFSEELFSNLVCHFVGKWLQNEKLASNFDIHKIGYNSVMEYQKHVLLNFHYLLGVSLQHAATNSISSLLRDLSLLSRSFALMTEIISMLPSSYFIRFFRTIISYIHRMIHSYEVDSPSGVSLSGWDPKDSLLWGPATASASSEVQTMNKSNPFIPFADSSNSLTPEIQDSRGSLDLMYEERKSTLLLLLRRMNSLELSERGDMELLNSLWKLLNSCNSRDYFTLICEFLPFVILHYSVGKPWNLEIVETRSADRGERREPINEESEKPDHQPAGFGENHVDFGHYG